MLEKQLIRWSPLNGVTAPHLLVSFSATPSSLDLILKEVHNPLRGIKISFEHSVVLHRITNESLRISADNISTDINGQPMGTWTFYTVSNSRLISWLLEEGEIAPSKTERLSLTHFICGDIESYIEIVATATPKAEWITYGLE